VWLTRAAIATTLIWLIVGFGGVLVASALPWYAVLLVIALYVVLGLPVLMVFIWMSFLPVSLLDRVHRVIDPATAELNRQARLTPGAFRSRRHKVGQVSLETCEMAGQLSQPGS